MKKIYFIISIILICIVSVSAFTFMEGIGTDVNTPVSNNIDVYRLSDVNAQINIISQISDAYQRDNHRFILETPDTNQDGFIISDQYGDFYINESLVVFRKPDNISCPGELVEYGFEGTLNNYDWGFNNIEIDSSSYYCPVSQAFNFVFFSPHVEDFLGGSISISSTGGLETITLTGSNNNLQTTTVSSLLDANNIAISGLISGNISGATSELESHSFQSIDYDVGENKIDLKRMIQKNMVQLTKGVLPESSTNLSTFSQPLHYYDFSGQTTASPSHINNSGEILTLGTGGAGINFDKIGVDGSRTLIVKGGNLYINADIYNASQSSILVIVVTRDNTDIQNGGNIYIHPEVTNIDAIIVAEGSILNYNGGQVLSASHQYDVDELRNQLLIYGSISTSNTIGESRIPYDSDDYVAGDETSVTDIYNLEYLRSLRLLRASDISHSCPGIGDVISVNSQDIPLQYSFSGKKLCYFSDDPQPDLRPTSKFASLVIEFNPQIQLNPPKILQK